MKKNFIAVLLVLLMPVTVCFSQDIATNQVPSPVSNSFTESFPKAQSIEWEKEGERYKVEFGTGMFSNDQEAWFDSNGQLQRHEEDISAKDLPKAVRNAIKSGYKDHRIDSAEKITANGITTYQVELENRDSDIDLLFDPEGNIVE